jgi:hypothetical protein
VSHYVYGLRLRGDPEVRYVGMTSRAVEQRLAGHMSIAGCMPRKTAFCWWLLENRAEIEAFKIARVETLEDAVAHEKVFIAFCLKLDHRLFNRKHVPADRRLPEYREQELAWKAAA